MDSEMPVLYDDDSNNAASVYYTLWSDWFLLNPPGLSYENISIKSEPPSARKLASCASASGSSDAISI
jgi:hypothetical protein